MADHASVEPNWVQYRIWPPLIAAGNQARQTPLQSKQALGELLQQYVWFIYPFFPSSFFFKRENLEGLALLLKDVCVTFSFPLAPLQDILGHPFSNGCTLFANRHRTPPPPPALVLSAHSSVLNPFSFARCQDLLSPILCSYLWQREPFRLEIIPPSEVAPGHLRGKTEFGDNIDDEWFIVYMLRMLTSHIEGASASVEDNDGEFLLIEAAEQIPAWLSPENAENRVFFHGGKLHLVPHPTSPSDFGLLPVGSASVYGNMYMYIYIYHNAGGKRASDSRVVRLLLSRDAREGGVSLYVYTYLLERVQNLYPHPPSLIYF